ncbi:sulfotransferase family protein [Steroidobacter agaridevorans]|uniref:sulfotransferase family protein n=1 Tax=Steroidobacter agaridevorans TaxID=2695856 RepID=UPI001AD946FB|nr:sulfotransferase [Steroidobacter agaridevorans]
MNGPIDRPIVITGLPRSGTTALHKLMSVDPQFQGLESWLLEAPMIRPPRGSWEHHYRYRSSVARIDALNANIPSFRRVHETIPFEVEECTLALMQSFVSSVWSESYVVPTYAQWLSRQSDDVAYLRHADILRLIGANEMRKRWLLKSPHHMYHIEALLSVFPDACIIQTHRDPLDAIPSVCSLAYTYWRDLEGKVSWREKMGLWKCAHWKAALDRMQSVRTSSSVQGQFFDVDHRRFLADPLEVVRSIYEYFVLRLSPSVERSMKDRIMRNPTARHGKHQYNVDICGATGAQIREIFADYRRQNQFD